MLLTALLQQRQESSGGEVQARDVRVVRRVPVLKRSILVIEEVLLHLLCRIGFDLERVAGDTSVVDENAEAVLSGGVLLVELLYALLVTDVGLDGDDLAGDVLAVLLDDGIELLLCAAGDVDLCAVDGEGLGGHEADARATT